MKNLPIRIRYKQVILPVMAFVGAHFGTVVGGAAIVYVPDQSFVLNADGELGSVDIGGLDQPLRFFTLQDEASGLTNWRLLSSGFHQFVREPLSSLPMRFDAGAEIGEDLLTWTDTLREVTIVTSGGGQSQFGPFYDTEGFIGIRTYEEESGWENEEALPYYG